MSAISVVGPGCQNDEERCGPSRGTVVRVVDGDTIELSSGETVRLLMIDTPETTGGATDCYGQEAKQYLTTTLITQEVDLAYDAVCEDQYGRLLAYVSLNDRELNTVMVERGYACVLHIPPNGDDREEEFETLEYLARTGGVGMWGVCQEVTCD
jgi:micrococcal nuclease